MSDERTFELNIEGMRTELKFGLIVVVAALAILVVFRHSKKTTLLGSQHTIAQSADVALEQAPQPIPTHEPTTSLPPASVAIPDESAPNPIAEQPVTNKLDRLHQIRETFLALAGGDPATALRAAKQLTDGNERETALMTLLTEWTHGELGPAQRRAQLIARYGLEAGLAIELSGHPNLGVVWADEMTTGNVRKIVYGNIAADMLADDPAKAFALADRLPDADRVELKIEIYSSWASTDTDGAFKYADQIQDPDEKQSALTAIRAAAPVGIGAMLKMDDGYPVINDLVPDSPAQLSGQLHQGDRILGLAQGDNTFVDARNLSLQKIVEMVRGAPNTLLQLQVVAPDDPASTPRTVSIYRNQLKFKR